MPVLKPVKFSTFDSVETFIDATNASLKAHVDESDAKELFGGIRGQLLGRLWQGKEPLNDTGLPGLVVALPGGPVAEFTGKKTFGSLVNYSGHRFVAVQAPPGSMVLWRGDGLHANAKKNHKLAVLDLEHTEVSLDSALANTELVLEKLRTFNVCVVTGVLDDPDSLTHACVEAVLASRPHDDVKFKGSIGSSLCKQYGISTHEGLREFAVNCNVLALWSALLFGGDPSRGDELCYSPDSIAFCSKGDGCGDLHANVTRSAMIMCYGDGANQVSGEGARKLAYYKVGGTCNHPPNKFTKGGSGCHYSNGGPLENRWKEQMPTWGKNPEVDARFVKLLGN